MSVVLSINNTDYFYPETGDVSWGPDATDWAVAVTSGMLQKAGGLFQLLAEVDFGPNYGLKSAVYKSRTANISTTGILRLAHADTLSWRNQVNDGDLALSVNASDELLFNGNPVGSIQSVADTASIALSITTAVLTATLSLSAALADTGYINASSSVETDGLQVQVPVLVGDSGAGGTAGVAPAPMAGDAAAEKFLKADGTWTTPPTAGNTYGNTNSVDLVDTAGLVTGDLNLSSASPDSGNINAVVSVESDGIQVQVPIMVGDSGAGGTSGTVPVPGVGDAANFLRGDGTWAASSSPLTFDDTNSINLTNTGGAITADLNLSAASVGSGNKPVALSIQSDGLQAQIANSDIIAAVAGTYVTAVSVASANGFVGSSGGGTTPALTLSTTVTGILKGNGTAMSAAVAADFPTLNQNTTGTASNVTGVVALINGGTGTAAATANAAFNALSPMTAAGDLIYGGASGAGTRLVRGTANQALTMLGSQTSPSWNAINQAPYANYLAANPNFEVDTTGYAAYSNTAGTAPVTGSGGSPTVTITRSTSSPLFGTASGLFTKDAANRQGQGFSFDFVVDSAVSTSATPCTITGYYKIASGTYVTGDMTVWIYDVSNGVVIQPSASSVQSVVGAFPIQCEFQPATNSTSYRLCFHVTSTSASAYAVQFDQLAVTPNTYNPGAVVTDWVSYTPTTQGLGTPSSVLFQWRRVGGSIEVQGTLTAGTVTASELRVGLPSGLVTSVLSQTVVGRATRNFATTNNNYSAIAANASTYLIFASYGQSGNTPVSGLNGNDLYGTGQSMYMAASVPIAGWGTSQVLSSDTDTRVVDFSGNKTSTQSVTADTTNITYVVVKDSHSVWTGSEYVVAVPGDYFASAASHDNSSTSTRTDVYLNGTLFSACAYSGGGPGVPGNVILPNLVSGDRISFRNGSSVTLAAKGRASISRISGPAQIASSETISAKYIASVSANASTTNPAQWSTKVWDTHGAVTTGSSWKFTAPAPGKYRVSAVTNITASSTNAILYKNGSSDSTLTTWNSSSNLCGSTEVQLVTGDFIQVRTTDSVTIAGDSLANICIDRVGN